MTRVHDPDRPRPVSPVHYRILPQFLPLLFSVLLDFCFLKNSFDITHLFQSLPSSLLSLKVSQSPQRHTKSPHPAHFYPIASLHRTLCNPPCTFLPPVQGVPINKHVNSKECQANLWWWGRRHPQRKLRCL